MPPYSTLPTTITAGVTPGHADAHVKLNTMYNAMGNMVYYGTGSPEGVVTAIVGAEYTDKAGADGLIKWVKTTGTGNTGWRPASSRVVLNGNGNIAISSTGSSTITSTDSIPLRVAATPATSYADVYYENLSNAGNQMNTIFILKNDAGTSVRAGQVTNNIFNKTPGAENSSQVISTLAAGAQVATVSMVGKEVRLLPDGVLTFGASGPAIRTGTGMPEGIVLAPVGTIYIDRNATNGAVQWTKTSGTAGTGWAVTVGDTGWRNVSTLINSNHFTGTLNFRRIGNLVEVEGAVTATSTDAAAMVVTPATVTSSLLGFTVAETYPGRIAYVKGAWPSTATTQGRKGPGGALVGWPITVTTGDVIQIASTYMTRDQWPSTLPGTAA